MINDITLVTPPDFLYNDAFNLLVICPGELVKSSLNDILKNSNTAINLMLYAADEPNIGWLLTASKTADCIVLDLDNLDTLTANFASLLIAKPTTFYLTNNNIVPYNLISKNRIYDLAWLNLIINRGKNEET